MNRLLLVGAFLFPAAAAAVPAKIAVADFDYVDTSGEVRDQRAAHAARLAMLAGDIESALKKTGHFTTEKLACPQAPCSAAALDQDQITAEARAQNAQYVVFGGVHKMSTLIQFGRFEVMNVATGKRVLARDVTFRGDSDDAWQHAADYVSQMLVDALRH